LELRGTPRLGRILALPVASIATAALGGSLVWGVAGPDRLLGVAVVSVGIFGVYELVRSLWLLSRQRRVADDWLRDATGRFVPPVYAWRAEQLCSPHQRRRLARTLKLIERSAFERPVVRRRPLYLPAVREHRESMRLLARALESLAEPVTPAGMLRVGDLVSDGASPLWGTTRDTALGDAISTTLAMLTADGPHPIPGARAA
jgi:hypothetical protein